MKKLNKKQKLNLKKTLKKAVLIFVVGVVMVGFLIYEGYSIAKKEYNRQTEIANDAHEEINLDLNLLKIAVQTGDAESYTSKLGGIRNEKAKIEGLFMIQSEQAEYVSLLDEYLAVLDGKEIMINEMRNLKDELAVISKALKDNYGNKDEISRDKVTGAKNEILKLKIDTTKYETEKVSAIVKAVNEIIDGVSDKAGVLADCVDTCYKDRINTVNDELADKIKAFSDQAAELNSGFEKEFEFEKMDVLLSM